MRVISICSPKSECEREYHLIIILFVIFIVHPTLKKSNSAEKQIANVFFSIFLLLPFVHTLEWNINFPSETRQSKQCGFSIYIFDNLKSKSMVRLVRAENMVLSGLVFARKIARMILIQNLQGLMGPLMINMAFMP